MIRYMEEVEVKMQRLFARLSEKDRRCYAAIEAVKLNHGGIEYLSELFKIDPKTVRRGMIELHTPKILHQEGLEKKGRMPMFDRANSDAGRELPQATGRIHRRRAHAGRRVVDELISMRNQSATG